jgi:hypothetical protein
MTDGAIPGERFKSAFWRHVANSFFATGFALVDARRENHPEPLLIDQ